MYTGWMYLLGSCLIALSYSTRFFRRRIYFGYLCDAPWQGGVRRFITILSMEALDLVFPCLVHLSLEFQWVFASVFPQIHVLSVRMYIEKAVERGFGRVRQYAGT